MKKLFLIIPLFVLSIICITVVDKTLLREKFGPKTWDQIFGKPAYKDIDPDKPLESQTATIQIGERIFKIPLVFIRSNLGRDGKKAEADGINLIFVYPDFTSRADFPDKAAYDRAFQNKEFGRMLVMKKESIASPVEMVENRKNNEQLTKYEGLYYGLKKYIDHDSTKHLNIRYDDTYLEVSPSGDVISFLSCDADSKALYPVCSHKFQDNGLYYSVSFNKKKYLSDWKAIQKKAIDFIDGFEINKMR